MKETITLVYLWNSALSVVRNGLNSVTSSILVCWAILYSMSAPILISNVAGGTFSQIADLPEAKELVSWFESLPQSQEEQHPAFEFFRSLRASLSKPSDGRQRFILPASLTRAKRNALLLKQAFPSESVRQDFELRLNALLASIRREARSCDTSGQHELAFRWRWIDAGLSPLSSQRKADNWAPAESILNPKRSGPLQNPTHPITGWRGSSYEWIRTPHFDIASRGSKADALLMAEICEQVYAVWQQVFYSYWAENNEQTGAPNPLSTTPFQVVLFASKREYEDSLKRQVPNIELSTGFYNQNARHSFFYLDQSKNYSTLVHELTHQFFAEATTKTIEFDPDASLGFWVAEGAALYMESMSLRDLGSAMLIDVGGWDAPRLQSARFHFLRNETWLTIDSFGKLSGSGFRKPEDIALRYSFACGLFHRWMDSGQGTRQQMVQRLKTLYFQDVESYLEPWDDIELPKQYADFMRDCPPPLTLYLPYANRNDLVLSRCDVTSEQLVQIFTNKPKWNWIDLSFNQIDDTAFSNQPYELDAIRLSLEGSRLSDESMAVLARMPKLEELDLSQCRITDQGVRRLQGNRSLRTLWLTGTEVSDESLKTLESCSRLESLHLNGTKVTTQAWERLMKAKPRLRANSTSP